jgi:hypothetical protein
VVCLALVAALALAVDAANAGAGRTRPGGSGGASGAPPQRAAGRATYGYGGGHYGHHGHHYGYYGHGPYYGGHYYLHAYAAWPWGWWYGSPPYRTVWRGVDPEVPGGIETDVQPKKAEVRLDGSFVGQARDYNGRWDVLWVEPGEHVLEFVKDGYMTLRVYLEVSPGTHVRIAERLQQGEGVDPRSTERPPAAPATPPERATREDRSPLRRGLLRLGVAPSDAAVYLDGEFLARAGELARLHGALPVAEGLHTVEVVRPGYESRTVEIEVLEHEPTRIDIVLEPRD